MKITWREVRALENFIQRCEDGKEKHYVYPTGHSDAGEEIPWGFFADHPHLLMPMGFDEYVAFANKLQFGKLWFADSVEDTGQSLYRRPSGQWLLLFGAPTFRRGDFLFHSKSTFRNDDKEDEGALRFNLDDLFARLYEIADDWLEDEHILWSPELWTPKAQQRQTCLLTSTRDLLAALRREQVQLRDVGWSQLENIVAEILRANEWRFT